MSQSSDVSDLIGGFKPLNGNTYIAELSQDFLQLIRKYFDLEKNKKMVSYLKSALKNKRFETVLIYLIRETKNIIQGCQERISGMDSEDINRVEFSKKQKKFKKFEKRLMNVYKLKDRIESCLIFKFIKGNLIKALQEGDWILLDEINLAQSDVLQNILPILENKSIILLEKGEIREVKRHSEFKLFGCMNPGNSVGKKELSSLIRKNFVEYFVHELEEKSELVSIIKNQSRNMFSDIEYQQIADLYLELRELSARHLITDGFNRKPTISLRALTRAIQISTISRQLYPSSRARSIIEGLFASLSSNLSFESKKVFEKLVIEKFDLKDEYFLKK